MNNQIDQQRFKTIAKFGIAGIICLLVAPIVFLMIKGLVGLAVAGVICATLIALMPAFSEWLTQIKFKALKGVISRAPVESLIQRAKERWDELETQLGLLKEQAAAVSEFKIKVSRFVKENPLDAQDWLDRLADYEKRFAFRVESFKKAKRDTHDFMKTIDRAEAIYEMALMDQKLSKSFGKSRDFMAIFREKTAFDAIDKANAQSMADLKMSMIDEDYVSQQTLGEQPVAKITYDTQGNVVLGNILNMDSIQVPVLKNEHKGEQQ
jgi:hypothetical protein